MISNKARFGIKKSTGNVVRVLKIQKKSGIGTKRVYSNGATVGKGMKTHSTLSKAKKAAQSKK